MQKLTITFLLLVSLYAIAFEWFARSGDNKKPINLDRSQHLMENKQPSEGLRKLHNNASAAKTFVKQKGFDTSVTFLIDMSMPASHKRFFIYDLARNTIQNSGLVTHGNCNQYWLEGRKYGNEVGCGCTSLGKYKIANSYYGRFGLAYKLHGLDKTNSNAFKRYVVLHAHSCVPDTEVPEEICQSNGCPTVSPQFLEKLTTVIKNSGKPVLLWIYD